MNPSLRSTPLAKSGLFTILLLCLINVLNYVDRQVVASVLNEIGDSLLIEGFLKENRLLFEGLLSYSFMVAYMILAPIVSLLVDRFGLPRKTVIIPGIFVWCIFTGLGGFAQTYEQLLLTRALVGVGEACFVATAPGLIADYFPVEKRGRILMWFYLAIPVGAALGFISGSNIAEAFGEWRYAFFLVGFPGALLAFLFFAVKEPKRGASHTIVQEKMQHPLPFKRSDLRSLTKNRSYRYVTLGMTAMTFAMGGLLFFFLKYFQNMHPTVSHGQAGLMVGGVTILAGIIGTLSGGILADFLNKKDSRAYFFVSGISMLLGAPFALVALGFPDPFGALGFILLAEILLLMNTAPSNAIILNVTVPSIRTSAFAINTFFLHMFGDTISPPIIGLIGIAAGASFVSAGNMDVQGLYWGLLITPVMMVVAGIFFLMGAPHYKNDVQQVEQRLQAMAESSSDSRG